jgi:soluble lytic murein transglycosylase-like protein
MPSTAKYLGVDPFDPSQAADGAARYLKELGAKWPGDEERMLAAYNTGPGTVRREGINPAGLRYIQKIKQVRQR